VTNDKGLREY